MTDPQRVAPGIAPSHTGQLAQEPPPLRTELLAGVTTFLTMAYIVFVNPAVLSQAGMDFGSVMAATCLAAAAGSLLMALLANYPIALAPGMGENFFLVTAVLGMGVTWQQGLAAVFLAGVLFLVLSVLRIREMILDGVPEALKHGIAAGIGLFVTMLGLVAGGIVVRHPVSPVVPVTLGDLHHPAVQTALLGTLLTTILLARRVPGAVLLGIVATALLAIPRGILHFQGIVAPPPSLHPTLLQLDLPALLRPQVWPVVLIFLYMAMFDAIGTLIGVGEQAGFLVSGKLPRATRALSADAAASILGAVMGTTTVTAYVESAAGVQAGARTGRANVATAALFLLCLFFSPLAKTVGGGVELAPAGSGAFLYPVTAPPMILVGAMMARALAKIPWDDPARSIPAFLTAIGIPLTYSIADGLALGFVSYPLVMLAVGRGREVRAVGYVLGALFVLRYALLAR